MKTPDTVVEPAATRLVVTMPAQHLCPHRDERDEGSVTISVKTGPLSIELHSLRRWIDGLGSWTVSHEAYTAHVREVLEDLDIKVVSVSTEWTTAGGLVRVEA